MTTLFEDPVGEVDAEDGTRYRVRPYAQQREDGVWLGWLEFTPVDPGRPVLRTAQDTVQPTCDAVTRWAEELSQADLETAFEQASEPLPLELRYDWLGSAVPAGHGGD